MQTASETETAPTEAQMQLTGSTILKLVWLTGAAAMALAVLAQNLLFLRRLKRIPAAVCLPGKPGSGLGGVRAAVAVPRGAVQA